MIQNRPLKLAIVGTRGIPAQYGGFETFAQELSIRLVKKGIEVSVYCNYTDEKEELYQNVKLKYMSCTKDANPLRYYKESIDTAVNEGNDIIVSCGGGGSLAVLNKKLHRSSAVFITNTDGIEYKRTKWNFIVRTGVRFIGEFISVLCSDYLIADSLGIKQYLLKSYPFINPSTIFMIEYGAELFNSFDKTHLETFGLTQDNYYLIVSRLEPENNIDVLIDGFFKSQTKKKLVIIGSLKETVYVKELLKRKSERIIFLNGIYDSNTLKNLRYGCAAYFHGHSVGGTNPSLLEALACGNIVLAHDNVFTREVTENKMFYFVSDDDCAERINEIDRLTKEEIDRKKEFTVQKITKYYNWERITDEYLNVFSAIYSKSEK